MYQENLQALKMKQSMRSPCGPAPMNHNHSELRIIYYDKSIYHVFPNTTNSESETNFIWWLRVKQLFGTDTIEFCLSFPNRWA